ncbi:MAG: 3'-5' exonuclease [Anaerolineales bacterium]|nr:3'-5' exonuclease [Anaerolineales bacterium]
MSPPITETYISVDIETAGPNPAEYALLSLGACTLAETPQTFYIEFQPQHARITAEARQVSRLDPLELQQRGLPPAEAMRQFADWLAQATPTGSQPVFVAFNAAFDWMFVSDYFHRYLGYNPFGHKALDIKAFYMGLKRVPWQQTGMSNLAGQYLAGQALQHHALQDALDQAKIFRQLLIEAGLW